MSATQVQIASKYLSAGFSVIPVKTDGTKEPAVAWKDYQGRLPTDAELRNWWGNGHRYGFGLVHGKVSGSSEVIDIETLPAFEEFAELCSDHGFAGILSLLPRIETPSGGIHLPYRCETAVEGNQKLARFATGKVKIETRGEGGYTLAPGSPKECHPDHKEYVLRSGKLSEIPVITAEERAGLLAMARACNEYADPKTVHRAAAPAKEKGEGDSEGLRPGDDYNDRAGSAAVLLILEKHGWAIDKQRGDTIYLRRPGKTRGMSATLNHCGPGVLYCFTSSAPPFDEEGTYPPFSVYGLLECGGDFAEAARQLGAAGYGEQSYPSGRFEESIKNSQKGGFVGFVSTSTHTNPTFDKPLSALDVDLLTVATLPEDMIPEPLRPWVLDIAHRGCFPLEFVMAPVIVALSAVVGRRMAIRPKRHDDWTVVPNLWGAVIGPPGIQKTPAVSEALRPLHRLEIDARKEHEAALKNHEITQAIAKAKAEGAKDRLKAEAKKPGVNDETLRQIAMDALRDDDIEAPTCRRYTVNDTTVEKLGELLKENPDGLLLFRDELTGFLKTLERQGHEADRAFYLEAWNGTGSYINDRIGRGTTVIEAACMSLFGTIQPGPLASYLRGAASGEEADGFAPRLQILVYPDPPRTFVNIDRYPDALAKDRAFSTFKRLAELAPVDYGATMPGENDKGLPYLNFEHEAQEFFDNWRTELEKRLRKGRDSSLMQTHLAKYRSLMPSLALLFHLLENVAGPVSLQAAQLAEMWCVFLEAHARRVYQSAMDGNPEAAQRLAERIKQSLNNPFTPREVMRKGWSGLATMEEVERAIGLLEEKGWVQTVEIPAGAKGGRPSTHVWINPELRPGQEANNPKSMDGGTDKTDKTPKTARKSSASVSNGTDKTDKTMHSTPETETEVEL